jgi:hypothetical protein
MKIGKDERGGGGGGGGCKIKVPTINSIASPF